MRRIGYILLGAIGLAVFAPPIIERVPAFQNAVTVSANSSATFMPGTCFAVDTNNALRHFNVAAPSRTLGTVQISGLQAGESILGIDFRPATGQLFGVGSTSRIYVINTVTGAASPVDGGFTPVLNGTDFGFDFNPTVDRIRLVSDAEQNLRLNPDTGAVSTIDLAINPAGNLVGSAYTNNFAGATTTVLYGIDSGSDQLVIQNPPNDGTLTPVGALGVDTSGLAGFDIAAGSGIAYASLTTAAVTQSDFYTINLSTGVATLVGALPPAPSLIRDIAVVAGPEAIFAVTTSNNLVRFNSNAPGTIVSTSPITGMQPGETMVGIDFRPATGQLYGLGDSSRIYRIDPANGIATPVGAGPFTPALSGTDFGFDFNPTVDRIRIVSDAEQNLRAHPDTGAIAVTDLNLNPAGNVVAAAYTNNFAGATTTTLYDIDSTSDLLLIQNPPNNGVLSAVGPLGVNATGLTSFDIAGSGMAFAAITLPATTTTNFYTMNLATGSASLVGTIGGGEQIRDMAVRVCTEVAYGITATAGGHNLVTFNAAAPGIIISSVAISGLQGGEAIRGADFRPATGQLIAVGSTSRLYSVNLTTGVATAIGAAPFTPVLNGTQFGVDFNPTVDRLRIVSDAEQNLRLNPNTGLVSNTDLALNPAGNVVSVAYTNNFAGATTTTLYDVDNISDTLLVQNPPNDGTLTAVGPLGVDLTTSEVGFDIATGTGNAFLSGYVSGPATPNLYSVNLSTGALTSIGAINIPGTDTLVDISILVPSIAGVDAPVAYDPATGVFFERNSNTPGPADTTFTFGAGGGAIRPVKGDWDGDGDDTPGIYDTTSGTFFLRNGNSNGPADAATFTFGPGGANFLPVVGDWDNDGDDTIGIYDSSAGNFFLKNTNTPGTADLVFTFGAGGAIPVAGDWNNDGTDTIGIYLAASGTFFLRNSNSNGPADIPPFTFGAPNLTPIAGDWNADGADTVGVYNSASAAWFLTNANVVGAVADFTFTYGVAGQVGLAGDWDGR